MIEVQRLIEGLQHTDEDIRIEAAAILNRYARKNVDITEAIPALVEALYDEDKGVRQNAAWAIKSFDCEGVEDYVKIKVRIWLILDDNRVLGVMKDYLEDEVVAALLEFTGDGIDEIKIKAIETLRGFEIKKYLNRSDEKSIRELLKTGDTRLKNKIIGYVRDEIKKGEKIELFSLIKDLLDDGHGKVRRNVATVFYKYGMDELSLHDKVKVLLILKKIDEIFDLGKDAVAALGDFDAFNVLCKAAEQGKDISPAFPRVEKSFIRYEKSKKIGTLTQLITRHYIKEKKFKKIGIILNHENERVRRNAYFIVNQTIREYMAEIKMKIKNKDYGAALSSIKKTTDFVMKAYSDRKIKRVKRELLRPLVKFTEDLHKKMNPLDGKEPMKWKKPQLEKTDRAQRILYK